MEKQEAKNRVRLLIKNTEFAKSKGYELKPSKKEILAMKMLIEKE